MGCPILRYSCQNAVKGSPVTLIVGKYPRMCVWMTEEERKNVTSIQRSDMPRRSSSPKCRSIHQRKREYRRQREFEPTRCIVERNEGGALNVNPEDMVLDANTETEHASLGGYNDPR